MLGAWYMLLQVVVTLVTWYPRSTWQLFANGRPISVSISADLSSLISSLENTVFYATPTPSYLIRRDPSLPLFILGHVLQLPQSNHESMLTYFVLVLMQRHEDETTAGRIESSSGARVTIDAQKTSKNKCACTHKQK